ncbi:hypothetical protein B0H34DRAFT_686632 [Crassisporium funariophilum]|nr:hypothetical protein B0H34DRAFT_686632 [Crassisporium funariophilum]
MPKARSMCYHHKSLDCNAYLHWRALDSLSAITLDPVSLRTMPKVEQQRCCNVFESNQSKDERYVCNWLKINLDSMITSK